MKYSQKQTKLNNNKMTKTLLQIYSGGGVSQPRGQTVELKQTVNRQCSYALAEFQSIRRGCHSLRLTSITTCQELILKTHLGHSARKSPEHGKLSTAQSHLTLAA